MYVFDDCVDFVGEMTGYARAIKNGEVTKEILNKSTYHLMDAFRYFAVQVVKKVTAKAKASTGAERYA